jgi:DNA replicative helicase MCM subunit Mcm2 (Cdc46/Mcm family)
LISRRENVESIDITPYPDLADTVERIYIRGKNLYIELKKPRKDIIIVTIHFKFTPFIKEIGRRLKEKGVDKEDAKDILNLIENNNAVIYKDHSAAISNDYNDLDKRDVIPNGSDASNASDVQEKKIVNVSECLKLHRDEVKATGNIVGITEPFKMVSAVYRECGCGEEKHEYNPPVYSLTEEKESSKCPKCDKHYKPTIDSVEYRNAITVYLQDNEKFNDIEKLTCILLDIDTERIIVGEKVNITGNIHIRPKSNQICLIPKVFAENLEYVNREQITVNDRDIEAIKRFAKLKGSSTIESLIDMLDRSIIGNNIAKEALLYSLISTGNDLQEIKKHKTRNRINVLLAGNPGLGKSSLLKKAITLIPNSRYESVQHSSAKSLTAIVSKEDEQHFLRLGPIPIAKGSVCGLNEIGTMTPDDQNHLLDIMEEGEFTINKHGFNSKILSQTTIIASTNLKNPINYDYGYDAQSSSLYQLPLEKQILDRFDLIVILKDNGDTEALKEYTEKKTEYQSRIIPNYECFLQKHIDYARKIKPRVSPEASKMIQQYYLNLNQTASNQNSESKRKLETIIRLSKVVAKLKIKEIVDSEDVIHATRFYNAMIYNYMGSTAQIPKDPVRLTIERCKAILKDNQEGPIMLTDLLKQVCDDDEYLKSYFVG